MEMINLRPRRPINYKSEEPTNDAYEFCERCGDFAFEYCSIHGGLLVVPDDKVLANSECFEFPRAMLTAPGVFLYIDSSPIPGAGAGVFAKRTLPQGVRFGPYGGHLTKKAATDYCWRIFDASGATSHVVDASDTARSNWMRYVNCARHSSEQNLVAYQYQGQIYYRTTKIIRRNNELLVFYGSEFAVKLNIHLGRYNKNVSQLFDQPNISSETQNTPMALADALKSTSAELQRVNAYVTGVINLDKYFNKEFKSPSDDSEVNIEFHSILEGIDVDRTRNRQIDNLQWNQVGSSTMVDESNCANGTLEQNNTTNNDETIKNEDDQKIGLANVENVGESLWRCDECSKIYPSRRRLHVHRRIHGQSQEFNCSICSYKTNVKHYFRRHERKAHNKFITKEKSEQVKNDATQTENITPWQCGACQKFFITRDNLRYHRRLHAANCEVSDQTDAKYNSEILIEDINSHQKPQVNSSIEVVMGRNSHVNVKAIKCEWCEYRCDTQKYLGAHMRRMHVQTKLHQCAVCASAFSCAEYLGRHVRRVHFGKKHKDD